MKSFQGRIVVLVALAGLLVSSLAQAVDLKIATVAPEGSEWMKEHRAAAQKIRELTDGRVVFKFYGGGVRGNDKKVLRLIRLGQLQGAAFTTSGLSERYFDIVLYGLPFSFRSQDEVDYVRGELDEGLRAGLEDAGFMSFGFAGGGFANFMSSQPIASHSNLGGKKIWVPDGDIFSFTALQSMQLSPVILPLADVMTGLQTGLIDVIVTPPVGALLLQWYTKVRYVNPMPVAYTLGILGIDKRPFDRLTGADQQVVTEVMTATYERLDAINRGDNVEAYDALLANGLIPVESNAEDVPYWRSVAQETNSRIWAEKAVDKGLYQEMSRLLEAYRASNPAPTDSEATDAGVAAAL
jgi:TRAP-type C4-dicarboxylate transport system substrate-binding protein